MSIIYDALKKVENTLVKGQQVKEEKAPQKPRIKSYLLAALAVCLVLFATNILMRTPARTDKKNITLEPLFKGVLQRETAPAGDSVGASKEIPPSLTLSGVFFSGGEGYALINNRIAKKGDKIDGAVVKQISLDEVELERDGSVIKLSSSPK